MQALIVDGANVVGSRPDGWWRDRPGAASRLWDRLTQADPHELPHEQVVLVLEGAARPGVAVGGTGRVRAVHASGSGDDAVVELTRELGDEGWDVVVVTADRGLKSRVEAVGADTVSPGWLLERL